MKAIDIIDAMTYDSDLAECSCVWKLYDDDVASEWIQSIFGGFHIKDGAMIPGHYLAIWQYQAEDLPFVDKYRPEVTLVRDDADEAGPDDREIYLWRIE